ncbi:uncharacterized protein BYT42DRAFT_561335 [Radiomyces spectabilis]|uniref:uncharacterized protein n=1 Tax=Radiomyces spectabilis TaxID=64574 RepID=UPI00222082E9|nr:uncharacterized protein BYT42DRAFT_561335 [Radiomyces spectabilis]KAI8388816.1 hypothetical protein BYT42DRAFT_561335 [Radiomyces spectabilis]
MLNQPSPRENLVPQCETKNDRISDFLIPHQRSLLLGLHFIHLMNMSTSTCEIDPALLEKIKEFRFAKNSTGNAAFVLQIDRKQLKIVEVEVLEDISIEELVEELPENTPRYVILSYELKHDDGRTNFPLVFIYWAPATAPAALHMLYTSAKTFLQEKTGVMRGFDIRDADMLTDEYLRSQL